MLALSSESHRFFPRLVAEPNPSAVGRRWLQMWQKVLGPSTWSPQRAPCLDTVFWMSDAPGARRTAGAMRRRHCHCSLCHKQCRTIWVSLAKVFSELPLENYCSLRVRLALPPPLQCRSSLHALLRNVRCQLRSFPHSPLVSPRPRWVCRTGDPQFWYLWPSCAQLSSLLFHVSKQATDSQRWCCWPRCDTWFRWLFPIPLFSAFLFIFVEVYHCGYRFRFKASSWARSHAAVAKM